MNHRRLVQFRIKYGFPSRIFEWGQPFRGLLALVNQNAIVIWDWNIGIRFLNWGGSFNCTLHSVFRFVCFLFLSKWDRSNQVDSHESRIHEVNSNLNLLNQDTISRSIAMRVNENWNVCFVIKNAGLSHKHAGFDERW